MPESESKFINPPSVEQRPVTELEIKYVGYAPPTDPSSAKEVFEDAKIEIDPEELKRLWKLVPPPFTEDKDMTIRDRREVSYVESIFCGTFVHFLSQYTAEINRENIVKFITKHAGKITRFGHVIVPKTFARQTKEKKDEIIATLFLEARDLVEPGSQAGEVFNFPKFREPKFGRDGFLRPRPYKYAETGNKDIDTIRQAMKGFPVVDLGAGMETFHKYASWFGASEYIAVDLPYDESHSSRGKEYDYYFQDGSARNICEALGIPIAFCPKRKIGQDMLIALYTKIPDNSSSFVMFGVDVTYDSSPEYNRAVNDLIAKKTKIGGIVLAGESLINLDGYPNFEKIKVSNRNMQAWRRVS